MAGREIVDLGLAGDLGYIRPADLLEAATPASSPAELPGAELPAGVAAYRRLVVDVVDRVPPPSKAEVLAILAEAGKSLRDLLSDIARLEDRRLAAADRKRCLELLPKIGELRAEAATQQDALIQLRTDAWNRDSSAVYALLAVREELAALEAEHGELWASASDRLRRTADPSKTGDAKFDWRAFNWA